MLICPLLSQFTRGCIIRVHTEEAIQVSFAHVAPYPRKLSSQLAVEAGMQERSKLQTYLGGPDLKLRTVLPIHPFYPHWIDMISLFSFNSLTLAAAED